MARITPAELWKLVVETGLCSRSAAAALRAEHDASPHAAGADAKAVATWLVGRGVLTRWQAKRIATGDTGPFLRGDYRLLERHEHDGEAFEFTARHEPSGRTVSLVLLGKKQWREPAIHDAILRRMTVASGTTDPLLVRTWALEEADGRAFAICEEVRGEPLADELARRGPLPPREAGTIVLEVARAVAELHAAGDVHGGLSLDALVREPGPGGRLRLRQFPLATDPHAVPPRPRLATETERQFLGRRAAFVAPELVAGAACDTRSDVYAIGCILHALVTGTAPGWHGDVQATLAHAAAAGPGPLDPAIAPAPLAKLVDFLTARDPRDRYEDAAEAARAIATTFGFPEPPLPAPAPAATGLMFADPAVVAIAGPTAARPLDPAAARAAAAEAARRRGRRLRFVGGAGAGAILAAAAAIVVVQSLPGPRPPRPPAPEQPEFVVRPPPPPEPDPAPVDPPAPPPPEPPAGPTIVDDDDTLPWLSPTAGPPPVLAYLPAGSQLLVLARPAALLADEEGRLFLKALGPGVERALADVAKACGCTPAEIEILHAGWQTEGADTFVAGWTARLIAGRTLPTDEAVRSRDWGPPGTSPRDGETIHAGPRLSYWAPAAAENRVLVAAPAARLAEIVEASTAADPPLLALPGDLEMLAGVLDGDRHLTVLGSPHYLLHSGRAMLAGTLEPLAAGLESLLGDSVQAAALSVHCGSDFYVELDAVATIDLPPRDLAARLAERIAGVPAAAKAFCAARDLHPYGRALVMELPTMVRALAAHTRTGAEHKKVAVANAYLPRHAGHNLVLAGELALAQAAGPVTAVAGPAAPEPPRDALGRLAQKMTLVFAKDTLEKSIQMISEEVGVPMEILGRDLELEGITKNQSFTLDERDKPAEAILRVILAKANPDGKLVYVVRKQGGEESILITTRAAVKARGDTLPPVFQESGGPPPEGPK